MSFIVPSVDHKAQYDDTELGAWLAVVEDALVEVVVPPGAIDVQVVRCGPDLVEAGALKDALRRDVVRHGTGFDPVQLQFGIGDLRDRVDSARGETATDRVDGEPVPDARAAERSGHHILQGEASDDPVVLEQ